MQTLRSTGIRILIFNLILALLIGGSGSLSFAEAGASEFKIKAADMGTPTGLHLTTQGGIILCDNGECKLFGILPGNEKPVVVAGRVTGIDDYGKSTGGYEDGVLAKALFASPYDIVPFLSGYAVSDTANNVIRYITADSVKTLGGSGKAGHAEGSGKAVSFDHPKGLAVDKAGNLYIADTFNNCIRKMDNKGVVTTIAGNSRQAGFFDGLAGEAKFNGPTGLAWGKDTLYVTDTANQRVRVIKDGKVSTLVGSAAPFYEGTSIYAGGFLNGDLSSALISNPTGITVDSSSGKDIIYIADTGNSAVRRIGDGTISTVIAPKPGSLDILPGLPTGLALHDGSLYVADATGSIYTINRDFLGGQNRFMDVKSGIWYEEAVNHVCDKGYFSGTGPTAFSPEGKMTRGMLVTVLARMYKGQHQDEIIKGNSGFSDVPKGLWYSDSVAWAADKGLVYGVGQGKFNPNTNLTRGEMVVLLYRYAKLNNAPVPGSEKDSADWAVNKDILRGKDVRDKKTGLVTKDLALKDSITRAEVATLILRLEKEI